MYNLRATSLTGSKLDAELRRYGAHTSGSTQRKQERLQRFMTSDADEQEAIDHLRAVVRLEQEKVQTRARARALQLVSECLK
jgi:hypothetical protein